MNPLLEKTRAAVLSNAKPQLAKPIEKTVEAGKKVMYDEKTRDMAVQQLSAGSDPESIGSAVAKLAAILFNQTKGTMPMQVLIPAATILLCEALQFLEDAEAVEVTPDLLAECTMAMTSAVLQAFGATPEQIQGYIDKAGGGGAARQAQPAGQPSGGIVAGAQGAM
jgi:hypothetical protein